MTAANPREIAWQLLNRWRTRRAAADELLEAALRDSSLDARNRRLATELFFGCIRRQATLDWLITEPLGLRAQRLETQNLLRLGLYQLFFLEKIPAHALVHETVTLAPHAGAKKFLNAVLRRACREQVQLRVAIEALRATDPAMFHSHPRFLWDRWRARYGQEQASALCDWDNTPPPFSLRVNTLKTTRERLLNELRRAKIEVEPSPTHPLAATLKNVGSVGALGAFGRGEFYVQDESTLAAVDALAPRAGESIADVCAAPAGKATYAAALMENRGRIIASDVSERRLKLVAENCARLGVNIVATICADAAKLAVELEAESFDGVLVDAPCTNTGVLRRRVDARWRLRESDIARLAAHQGEILQTAAKLVRCGGRLVYSTCSIEPEENAGVVEKFLGQEKQFAVEKRREMFPPRDGMDGGCVALLRRR